jgi:RNA polymerase sigma-70 factor, ECF subfamily
MAVITDRPPAGHGPPRVTRGSLTHDDPRLQEPPLERAPAPPDFDDVYDQHFAFAWRNLRRLGVHEPQLSDAAQDVFLVVHRRLPTFVAGVPRSPSEPQAPVRSWVYSIVVRVARQYRRGLRRKPTESLDDAGSVPDVSGTEPERSAQQSEALRQLLGLLDGLDENKREAFVLAELEGLTAPEIAEILGVNVNTIYARIRAARRALEALVAALPPEARG